MYPDQIRIIRASSPCCKFTCVTFHLASLLLFWELLGAFLCLRGDSGALHIYEIKNCHKLKSVSSSRPDRRIAIATKQPKKNSEASEECLCPSSTQKVSKGLS